MESEFRATLKAKADTESNKSFRRKPLSAYDCPPLLAKKQYLLLTLDSEQDAGCLFEQAR